MVVASASGRSPPAGVGTSGRCPSGESRHALVPGLLAGPDEVAGDPR